MKPPYAAPDFSLPDIAGNIRTLKEFKGKWIILYFYPKDDTPGCTNFAIYEFSWSRFSSSITCSP